MKKYFFKFLFLLIAFFFTPEFTNAADYYVSPDGSESAISCQSGAPCSVQRALSLLYNNGRSSSGDNVYFLAGTYSQNAVLIVDSVANGTGRLTLKPVGEALSVIIDGTNQNDGDYCIKVTRGYVTVDGFEIRNCVAGGIQVDGDVRGAVSSRDYGLIDVRNFHPNAADGVIIKNNYVHEVQFDGIKIGHLNDCLVENNEVYRAGRHPTYANNVTGQQGIDVLGVVNVTIRGNKIHDDPTLPQMHAGIFWKGGTYNVIAENNEIYNIGTTDSIGMEVGGDTEPYNTRYDAANIPNPFCGSGMSINEAHIAGQVYLTENPTCYTPLAQYLAEASYSIVRGNIIHDVGRAISYRNAYEVLVYNNTLYNAGASYTVYIDSTSYILTGAWHMMWDDQNDSHISAHIKIYNNLHYNSSSTLTGAAYWDRGNARGNGTSSMGFAADYNVLYNGGGSYISELDFPSLIMVDNSSITLNPIIDSSYRLASNSPAIGAGVNLRTMDILGMSESWTDRDGNIRNTQTDIGALLYLPANDLTAPSAPTGLGVQ